MRFEPRILHTSQIVNTIEFNLLAIFIQNVIKAIGQIMKNVNLGLGKTVGIIESKDDIIPILELHNQIYATMEKFNKTHFIE